jgi:colicin import membrane protein
MEALMIHPASDTAMQAKWGKMFMVSLALHLIVCSTLLFIPENIGPRKIQGPIYEVKLVELPRAKGSTVKTKARAKTVKRLAPTKTASTKELTRLKSKAKPVIIAKRTKKVETKKLAPPEDSAKNHIDQALEKIKKKVEAGQTDSDAPSVSRLKLPAEGSGQGTVSGRAEDGITIHLYRMEIYDLIKSNWSLPALDDKNLAAVILLTVQNTGDILKTRMAQSSGNERFDQSVLKAIKRSNPLPPFPEGYRKTREEIEINFNLSELEN